MARYFIPRLRRRRQPLHLNSRSHPRRPRKNRHLPARSRTSRNLVRRRRTPEQRPRSPCQPRLTPQHHRARQQRRDASVALLLRNQTSGHWESGWEGETADEGWQGGEEYDLD
jgi:hypothetical protein